MRNLKIPRRVYTERSECARNDRFASFRSDTINNHSPPRWYRGGGLNFTKPPARFGLSYWTLRQLLWGIETTGVERTSAIISPTHKEKQGVKSFIVEE